ncbi:ArsR family transcriptional regulator [Rhodococcus opacus M213]|uniref:ArsR family transcriptional regulator n=1 Tax=Rhodococcus opacus M213 TaxID=1129896 RepID=K8X813_RHOOP|nr:helix-turn-helix domain-containing protein [Rhodococcus opacus]EKT76941.1 ArsR family transcriptional regulator [Rhodococcus opacus M213]
MACTNLDDEARVSASTVSYHVKTLRTAGLVQVRKEGRSFHYTYRPEVIRHSPRRRARWDDGIPSVASVGGEQAGVALHHP